MKRHFYISDNLDSLQAIEQELEDGGVDTAQIHILSQ
jgi:ferredoxin-NADP reductase